MLRIVVVQMSPFLLFCSLKVPGFKNMITWNRFGNMSQIFTGRSMKMGIDLSSTMGATRWLIFMTWQVTKFHFHRSCDSLIASETPEHCFEAQVFHELRMCLETHSFRTECMLLQCTQ